MALDPTASISIVRENASHANLSVVPLGRPRAYPLVPRMRINDVGGMEGFGDIAVSETDPPFHADWEAHVYALNVALVRRGVYSLDEFRDAVERLAPQAYLGSSYYERWFAAIRTLLEQRGIMNAGGAEPHMEDALDG